MRKIHRAMLPTFSICFGFASLAAAAEGPALKEGLTAEQIIDAVENRDDGQDMISTVTLELHAKDSPARLRRFTLLRKEFPDQTKWVVYFTAPADVRNMAFLVWDLRNDSDRRWIYVPSVAQVRRLSAGDERKSFFGSDFVYEDLTSRDAGMDEHTIVGTEKFKNWDCVVVESKPKNPRLAEFSKMRRWVWKDASILVKMELYDASGKVFKSIWAEKLQQQQGIWNWHTSMAKNADAGTETKMLIEPPKYNTGVADQVFTEQQLSRGAP